MRTTLLRPFRWIGTLSLAGAMVISAGCAARNAQAPADPAAFQAPGQSSAPAASPQPAADATPATPSTPPAVLQGPAITAADSPVALGKARFHSYKCYECRGANGEGTNDAPDLTGTRLNAEHITALLQRPSPDANSAGMPTIASDNPDFKALVAFVVSLKHRSPPRPLRLPRLEPL